MFLLKSDLTNYDKKHISPPSLQVLLVRGCHPPRLAVNQRRQCEARSPWGGLVGREGRWAQLAAWAT